MKSIFRKSLSLIMILCFVLFGLSYVNVNVKADATPISSCDFTTQESGSSAYNTSWTYDTNWTVVNGANYNKGWTYVKFGGKKATLATSNPCYVYNNTSIDYAVTKITVHMPAGSLAKSGMSVNSWGIYAYSDKEMNTQIDYVAGGTISSAENTFTFKPSTLAKWPSGTYFKVSFDLANTSSTNGIILVDKIDFYNEYYISFNNNGGIGTDPETINVASEGTSSALPSNPYTYAGFTFKEWNTSADGTGTSYAVGATIANVTEDIELYAIWEVDSANNVVVTFNSNSGSSSTTKEQAVAIATETALESNTFTNGGKSFTGWNTSADGSGTAYTDGQSVTLNEALTLYAQWSNQSISTVLTEKTLGKSYSVQGEIVAIITDSQAIIQDSTGSILLYSSDCFGTSGTIKVGNIVSLSGNYKSYSNYSGQTNGITVPELESLSNIEIVSNDTTVNTTPLTNTSDVTANNLFKYIELNELYLSAVSGTSATVKDNDFNVYYSNADYVTGEENLVAGKYVNIKGIVYANATNKNICVTSITASDQYSLVFNVNGGTAIDPQVVLAGNKFTVPTAPTKEADATHTYEFAGWYTDTTYATEFDFNTIYSEDKVAYAKWDATEVSALQQSINNINAYMSLAYSYDYTSLTTYKYVKVVDASTLKVGDKLLFACDESKAYASTFNSDKHCIDSTVYTGTATYEGAYVFTLGGSEGAWTFTSSDGLLGGNSSLNLNVEGADVTTWTISISDGNATIASTDATCASFKYNVSSGRFKTYNSSYTSGKTLNLYKQVADKTINSADFRIRCGVDKILSSVVTGYAGATYGIEVSDGTNTRQYLSTNALYYTDDANCDYVIIDLGDCLTNISRLSTAFTVRAFVINEGTTYYSNQNKTYSVVSLLNTYYANESTKSLVSDFRRLLFDYEVLN